MDEQKVPGRIWGSQGRHEGLEMEVQLMWLLGRDSNLPKITSGSPWGYSGPVKPSLSHLLHCCIMGPRPLDQGLFPVFLDYAIVKKKKPKRATPLTPLKRCYSGQLCNEGEMPTEIPPMSLEEGSGETEMHLLEGWFGSEQFHRPSGGLATPSANMVPLTLGTSLPHGSYQGPFHVTSFFPALPGCDRLWFAPDPAVTHS